MVCFGSQFRVPVHRGRRTLHAQNRAVRPVLSLLLLFICFTISSQEMETQSASFPTSVHLTKKSVYRHTQRAISIVVLDLNHTDTWD